ncbi:response regulator [Sporomusa sp. GT1]|jgi:two-component system chemotaxis response regulator CheY|uniref:response regulator n=1 Tax=Sporomusa sp. GT1 TaxID=1534747 RepID=UPI000953147F|nr:MULTISPECIES: response regulator [Sporomusa]
MKGVFLVNSCISKVLICDDSMLVRKKLRDLLEEMHCQVYEAKDGAECVELFKNHQPGTVFMDIVMPELDGLAALKQIKTLDKCAKVIMLSSTGTSTKVLEALKHGATDFIQKPYTRDQIAKAIGYSE